MRDDYDDDDRDRRSDRERPFPKAVFFAGVTWIVFGCLILINGGIQLIMTLGQAGQAGQKDGGAQAVGGTCGVALIVLFGAAFLFVGIQSCKGTAKDTLGNAIGSLVFGLLAGGGGAFAIIGGMALSRLGFPDQVVLVVIIMGSVNVLSGLGLLAAGIMALIGRQEYKEWRRANRLD